MEYPKTIFISLIVLISSCAPKIYQSPTFNKAIRSHKTVAILPAIVNLQLRPNEAKKYSKDQIEGIVSNLSHQIQDAMYSWFLRKSGKLNYTVNFQDISRTNSLLKASNLSSDFESRDQAEIAKILGVDAIIQNKSNMTKPMSEGAAVALGVLVGVWGSTNKVTTTVNIHDGESGNLLWRYDHQYSGSIGSSAEDLVNALMRNVSKHFPYARPAN